MFLRTLAIGVALALVPAVALAVPPREKKPGKQQPTASRQKPAVGGSPSLSPRPRPMTGGPSRPPSRPEASRPSTNRPAENRPATSRQTTSQRPRPSILPADPDRWATQRPSRPSERPTSGTRPGYRPDPRPSEKYAKPFPERARPDPGPHVAQSQGSRRIERHDHHGHDHHDHHHHSHHHGHHHGHDHWHTRPHYSHLHQHWHPGWSGSGWSAYYRPSYANYYYRGYGSLGGVQVSFVNPFYTRPATVVRWLDYSQPIHVPAADQVETTDDLVKSEQAIRRFDDAREVFRRGEFGRANDLIDEAISLLPSDPTLHQFRALVLFARQRYPEAAAALYSVLAVSTPWDADAVARMYEDPQRYAEQVADLAAHVRSDPTAIEARFLLAYHDLVRGDLESAARNLEVVRIAKPTDRVILNLLTAIKEQTAQEN